MDPADVVPDFGVDSREVRVRTSDPPRHDALKAAVANQGPARVSLWRRVRSHYEPCFLYINEAFSDHASIRTWQESFPPRRDPAHSMLEVIIPQ